MTPVFGKCDCGAEAIVKLNGKAKCLPCFQAGLAKIPSPLQLARAFVEAQGGTLAPGRVRGRTDP